ncbi:MAG: efflux RND transporter periplasmic adaptor subunit [Ginsengibacter sp.]
MKSSIKALLTIILITMATACGNGKKERDAALTDKKVELEKLKTKMTSLEAEIAKLDTSAGVKQKAKLVAITAITKGDFKHYLDLQGSVNSKNISYITPAGQPGQIKAIYVKEGDNIRKGQIILKLDNSVGTENVVAIRTQMASVKAQLDLAKSVYSRQKNLWDQGIGTEVQLLQARTNVEALQGQLRSIQANVNAAQTQANQANVYSNVSGTVDEVTAHVGETFSGNPAAGGYIKIVSNSALKISVTVPESNASKIHTGTPVVVEIPDLNKTFNTTISFISQSVGATTRGVTAEAKVPAGMDLRPNQIAVIKLLDYTAPNSLAIPLNTLQTDENGKYVLVAVKEGNEMIARKRTISVGQLYGDKIEVKQGLKEGDQLITDGYQGVFDGELIETSSQ